LEIATLTQRAHTHTRKHKDWAVNATHVRPKRARMPHNSRAQAELVRRVALELIHCHLFELVCGSAICVTSRRWSGIAWRRSVVLFDLGRTAMGAMSVRVRVSVSVAVTVITVVVPTLTVVMIVMVIGRGPRPTAVVMLIVLGIVREPQHGAGALRRVHPLDNAKPVVVSADDEIFREEVVVEEVVVRDEVGGRHLAGRWWEQIEIEREREIDREIEIEREKERGRVCAEKEE
jgi:hypothetical protein